MGSLSHGLHALKLFVQNQIIALPKPLHYQKTRNQGSIMPDPTQDLLYSNCIGKGRRYTLEMSSLSPVHGGEFTHIN